MDVFPSFAVMFNGPANYLEFAYVRELKNVNFRVKLNLNKNSFLDGKLLSRRVIDQENDIVYTSTYNTRRNIGLNLGLAKRFMKGEMNYYFGVDSNFGLNFGHTISSIFESLNSTNNEYIGATNSTMYTLGLTPFLGAKIPLMSRVSLELELGVPMIYSFGDIRFLSESAELKEVRIEDRNYSFSQLLNDVRISFNF